MHQIAQIEFRNAKFSYARGPCPLATPARGLYTLDPHQGASPLENQSLVNNLGPPFQWLDLPLVLVTKVLAIHTLKIVYINCKYSSDFIFVVAEKDINHTLCHFVHRQNKNYMFQMTVIDLKSLLNEYFQFYNLQKIYSILKTQLW